MEFSVVGVCTYTLCLWRFCLWLRLFVIWVSFFHACLFVIWVSFCDLYVFKLVFLWHACTLSDMRVYFVTCLPFRTCVCVFVWLYFCLRIFVLIAVSCFCVHGFFVCASFYFMWVFFVLFYVHAFVLVYISLCASVLVCVRVRVRLCACASLCVCIFFHACPSSC